MTDAISSTPTEVKKQWVIVRGDGNIDYTDVFGPYPSIEQAESALIEDDEGVSYRVVPILNPAELS